MDRSKFWYLGLAPSTDAELFQAEIEAMYDREMLLLDQRRLDEMASYDAQNKDKNNGTEPKSTE